MKALETTRRVGLTVALALIIGMVGSAAGFAQDNVELLSAEENTERSAQELPYIYTQWKQFTTKDGLPNDHIFAVKVHGQRVWVGTENGLARIDKRTGAIRSWKEKDGLPWRVVSALDVDEKTGDLWVGMFGGGLARFSGGRFDHWHQLNSGLVNDVVYGVAIENDNVWAATTAGASRYNMKTGEWTIYTEKNSPMEEIWNYGVSYNNGKVYLGVWGSGVLEFDVATERWKDYLDPDGEMEIDLYRDDGIVHVITTGTSYIDDILWVSSYFGVCRYDGRHWRGFFAHECGLPSDFGNAVKGRSASEAWFSTDKGLGVLADFETDTWVTYTRDPAGKSGKAVVMRGAEVLETAEIGLNIPHNYVLWVEIDGNDAWVGTSKGLGWAIGPDYYTGLRERQAHVAMSQGEVRGGGRMKRVIMGILVVLAAVCAMPAGEEVEAAKTAYPDYEIDEKLKEILEKINAVDAYQVPDLGIKRDHNYARTPQDIEPFGGVKPYKEHFLEQLEYTGPGRAIPEPEHVDTVKLGFIGPIMSTVSVATGGKSHEESLGIQMLQGTRLAIEEANARGGYHKRGIPFELVISNDNGLWGASGNEIVKMAYKDEVWAILGTIDGANSHIAIRVALKAEVLMINTGDTDPTFIETNIPWVLRVIGDDRQQGYLLADYLYRKLDYQRVGIIQSSNRYGRFGVREIIDTSRRLGHPIVLEMAYGVGGDDFSLHLERLKNANVEAIVHWGDAREGALILNQMREMGMKQPYFASDRSVSEEFVEIAGANAEGVICGFPWNPTREGEALEIFRGNFRKRFGVEPGTYGAHAYDGMNMLIWAVQTVGLNRAKIRDVLAYMPRPWPGVTGDIALSATLDDVGDVFLAKFEKGEWNYHSRRDLQIPRGYIPPRDRTSRGTAGGS